MYGPVAGIGVMSVPRRAMAVSGVPTGTANANGMVSLFRKSESGSTRWNVTVPASSSVSIPADRSHGSRCWHFSAPTIVSK
jgi:hypothetical protein